MHKTRTRTRRVLLTGVSAGLVLALAGCGGGSTPQVPTALGNTDGAGSTPSAAATSTAAGSSAAGQGPAAELATYVAAQQKWVACMRQHGFDLPDPDAHGLVKLTGFPKSQPKARAAWVACQPLAVAVPESVQRLQTTPLTPAQQAIERRYATCMQTHGAPDFPDPGPDGDFKFQDWNQTSAGAAQATKACEPIIGVHPTGPSLG
jgi:hypothetical protein